MKCYTITIIRLNAAPGSINVCNIIIFQLFNMLYLVFLGLLFLRNKCQASVLSMYINCDRAVKDILFALIIFLKTL